MNSFMFQNPPFNHYVQPLFLRNMLYSKIPWIEIHLLGLCFNPTHYKVFLDPFIFYEILTTINALKI